MHVYRMEHRESRIGPFQGESHQFSIMWRQNHRLADHPTPPFDGVQNFRLGIDLCGVDSLDGILDWFAFDDELMWLKENDFVVRVYDIPNESCQVGRTQVVFPRATRDLDSILVEEIEL